MKVGLIGVGAAEWTSAIIKSKLVADRGASLGYDAARHSHSTNTLSRQALQFDLELSLD